MLESKIWRDESYHGFSKKMNFSNVLTVMGVPPQAVRLTTSIKGPGMILQEETSLREEVTYQMVAYRKLLPLDSVYLETKVLQEDTHTDMEDSGDEGELERGEPHVG